MIFFKVRQHVLYLKYKLYNKLYNKTLLLGYRGKNATIGIPSVISRPELVYMHDYTRIQRDNIIYNYTGKFIMKEYSGASIGLLVVTGNHRPTVGIPHYMLPLCRINDDEKDVIVEEDVWIGAKVTLLAGAHIGRGAVVGACTLVNKEIPPYAVVVGIPAHIVSSKFSIDQIIEHEKQLYPENKRYSRSYLEQLFSKYYSDKRSIGLVTDLQKSGFVDFMKEKGYDYIK